AGWPNSAARCARLSILHAPSSSEYSEWTWRWAHEGPLTGPSRIGAGPDGAAGRTRTLQGSVELDVELLAQAAPTIVGDEHGTGAREALDPAEVEEAGGGGGAGPARGGVGELVRAFVCQAGVEVAAGGGGPVLASAFAVVMSVAAGQGTVGNEGGHD